MAITITSTNYRFSKGMTLDGNVLSGDTYNAKQQIKTYWDGKWNAEHKVWIVNPQKVMDTLNSKYNWGLSIGSEQTAPTATTVRTPRNSYELTREMDRKDSDY